MSARQVNCVIQQGFKSLGVQKWTYLLCGQHGLLATAPTQDFDGADVVRRKGSLYLSQVGCPGVKVNVVRLSAVMLPMQD